MIDLHSHILPGIDDGSPNVEISINQLKMMEEKGVTDVVCSSHFMKGTFDNNREILDCAYEELQKEVEKEGLKINLIKGAECYIYDNIMEDIKTQKLQIGDTKYVLVETTMIEPKFSNEFYTVMYNLLREGYKPILAHPERYRAVTSNPSICEELISRNIYLQLNAGSLIGDYGKRSQEVAWILVSKGWAHFVSSDTHCKSKKYPLRAAKEILEMEIDSYTAKLLTEINPKKVINDLPIDYSYLNEIVDQPIEKPLLRRILDAILAR